MSFDLSQGVGVACKMRFGKPEDAVQMKAQMDMAVGMVSLLAAQKPELMEAIQSFKTNIEGGNITIDINFTEEQIAAAIEAAKEMKESMGAMGGGMPGMGGAGSDAMVGSLGRARGGARRTQSRSNLRQIGLAIIIYANDHRGVGPKSLGELADGDYLTRKGAEVLRDPCVSNDQREGDSDYILRKEVADGSLRIAAAQSEPIVWSDPLKVDTVNVLFGDGAVMSIEASEVPAPSGGASGEEAPTQWPELVEALKAVYAKD